MMKTFKYIIYKEGKYYISQSLNVDVSSFGGTIEEATKNLKEALELYFDDEQVLRNYQQINETFLGEINLAV
nr:type II toxin-antitoxin system HicB family antitoxin [Bacteroidota bacterium]